MDLKPLRVIFINYGSLNSNSGGHIANFANAISKEGHTVGICADGNVNCLAGVLDENISTFPHEAIDFEPENVIRCGSDEIARDRTVLHVWTPREKVIALTKRLLSVGLKIFFVHLEDNEELLAAANLGMSTRELLSLPLSRLPNPYPYSLSHPLHYKEFIRSATGVTVIVPTLAKFVPSEKPWHLLEPGVDTDSFAGSLSEENATVLRRRLGVHEDEYVCVYHGNMHVANQREIFSLYTAFLLLKRRGRRIRLIRAGKDFTPGLDVSFDYLKKECVLELGYLEQADLLEVLKLADFFVQPGTSNSFNDYRFPSKIPEFLALGRPVILPATNIGLRMRDGVDGLLLHRGDGEEIASKIELILDSPDLAHSLGLNARHFALRELSWEQNAKKLINFYAHELLQAAH